MSHRSIKTAVAFLFMAEKKLYSVLAVGFGLLFSSLQPKPCVVDSKMSLEVALSGKVIPSEIRTKQVLLPVKYIGYDNKLHCGQLVVHKAVANEVDSLFKIMLNQKFPIKSCIPVSSFNWDDDASMQANNTSSFNYRTIAGTKKVSKHAQGLAIDINPLQNPQIKRGVTSPFNGSYNAKAKGTLVRNEPTINAWRNAGWVWGGSWRQPFHDYMHLEKYRWK